LDRHAFSECSASDRRANGSGGFLKSAILHGRVVFAN
jgi:hypothetical protein